MLQLLFVVLLPLGQGFTTAAEFRAVLNQRQVGRLYRFAHADSGAELMYLGAVTDGRGRAAYHVVREFGTVPAAIGRHGYTRLLFFGPDNRLAVEYQLSMPEDLPYRLRQNTLYFRLPGGATHKQPLPLPLPNCICVAPRDCYFR